MNRFEARFAVMLDLRLSPNARILYFLMDDKAGDSGVLWWHWRKLAVFLGVGEARFFELLAELRSAGLIRVDHNRQTRKVTYSLQKSGVTQESHSGKLEQSLQKSGVTFPIKNLPLEPEETAQARERQNPGPSRAIIARKCKSCAGRGEIMIQAIGWARCAPCTGTGREGGRGTVAA